MALHFATRDLGGILELAPQRVEGIAEGDVRVLAVPVVRHELLARDAQVDADVEKAAAAYDSKCLVCHSRTQRAARARLCKVGKTECVTCHMPKIELPGAHTRFTDHRIRIARAGEAYPD